MNEVIIYWIIFTAAPMLISWFIAGDRNRSKWKSLLVTFFFGWFGLAFLAMFLKVRDPKTGFLR